MPISSTVRALSVLGALAVLVAGPALARPRHVGLARHHHARRARRHHRGHHRAHHRRHLLAHSAAAIQLTVNSTADDANAASGGVCRTAAGACTLRAAIQAADAAGGATIGFDIPGGGVQAIAPHSPLPTITAPVTIDGYTQPGASTATGSTPATILIEIAGPRRTAYAFDGDGLVLGSGATGSLVRGLQVTNFLGYALHVRSSHTKLAGDRIGADTFFSSDSSGGILLDETTGDTVGGGAAADRDVVTSSPFGPGVQVTGGSGALIQGDYIGPDATGIAAPFPNATGVALSAAKNAAVLDDVISGNYADGVQVSGGSGIRIAGDYVGLDATGEQPLGNGFDGVSISDSPNATVGGTTAAARDVVSASGQQGIYVTGAASTGLRIVGDYVGTDAQGSAFDSQSGVFGQGRVFGNYLQGIYVTGAPGAVIGAPGTGNLLNNNGFTVQGRADLAQIALVGPGAGGASIQSNRMGVTPSGAAIGEPQLGNAEGIAVDGGSGAHVGGPQAGDGNVVADMQSTGIQLYRADGAAVQDNLSGTDATGTRAAGNNTYNSAEIDVVDSSNVLVGGARPAPGTQAPCASGASGCSPAMRALGPANLASAANDYGSPSGSFGIALSGGSGSRIQGNLVGTDITGEHGLGNGTCGVVIQSGAGGTLVGGGAPGEGNVISDNGLHGLQITAGGTVVEGNRIGTDESGEAALGNGGADIDVLPGSSDTTIGGLSGGEGNLVSGSRGGSGEAGIELGANGAAAGSVTNTVLQGNRVGTNAEGTRALRNVNSGIDVLDGVSGLTIGGSGGSLGPGAAANLISGNGVEGIRVHGAATGVRILGNLIGTAADGTTPLGNADDGIGVGSAESGMMIGDTATGGGNVIADNGLDGVYVSGAQRITIRGNSIFANHNLGIELAAGGNASLAAPQLQAGGSSSGSGVSGTLAAQANAAYTIDFYSNPSATGAQGKRWVGAITVHTDSGGQARFSYSSFGLAGAITATATDSGGDTSEFSNSVG